MFIEGSLYLRYKLILPCNNLLFRKRNFSEISLPLKPDLNTLQIVTLDNRKISIFLNLMRAIIVQRKKSLFSAKSDEKRYCFFKEIAADRNVRTMVEMNN